ncbi:MAG TPA: DUF3180 domain-containing protein [Sporichthyaceae bacterium]|nr:DUF3180 domain-containing protein [Sporichthyaceae bacterium]
MRPTRWPILVAVAVLTGAVGWGGALIIDGSGRPMPRVPGAAPSVLLLLAVILFALAFSTRSRLRAARDRVPGAPVLNPLTIARYVVLARASSPVGAGTVGLYGGYALFLAGNLDEPSHRHLAAMSGLAVGTGVALVAAALFLEYVCRVPDDQRPSRVMPDPRDRAA